MTNRQGVCINSLDKLDKEMIHIPGRMELDGARVYHTAQNGAQFKMYGLFISGTSHLIFFGPQVTETMEK